MYFPVNLAKIFRILFLKNTSGQLLSKMLLKQFRKFSRELKTPYNIIFFNFFNQVEIFNSGWKYPCNIRLVDN